jgi:inhibitor of KinA
MGDAPFSLSFSPLGDRALLIEFAETPDPEVTARVRALADFLQAQALPGVTDLVPALCSLALHYEPDSWHTDDASQAAYDSLVGALQELIPLADEMPRSQGALIEIPVVYGGEFGEDLEALAAAHGISAAEAADIHASAEYTVYMLGFVPGFAYLGPLDERLTAPRRETPRVRVPAGSVAVANGLTGIYPVELPGGWHVIGRTPLKLFDLDSDPPARLAAGDRVRFVAVDAARFREIEGTRS